MTSMTFATSCSLRPSSVSMFPGTSFVFLMRLQSSLRRFDCLILDLKVGKSLCNAFNILSAGTAAATRGHNDSNCLVKCSIAENLSHENWCVRLYDRAVVEHNRLKLQWKVRSFTPGQVLENCFRPCL